MIEMMRRKRERHKSVRDSGSLLLMSFAILFACFLLFFSYCKDRQAREKR
jgi:hypothetical protein